MSISDWSSDVCSSDLLVQPEPAPDGLSIQSRDHRVRRLLSIERQRRLSGAQRLGRRHGHIAAISALQHRTQGDGSEAGRGRYHQPDLGRLFDDPEWLVLRFPDGRSEEHTSELQSLMRISYAVFCLKKK